MHLFSLQISDTSFQRRILKELEDLKKSINKLSMTQNNKAKKSASLSARSSDIVVPRACKVRLFNVTIHNHVEMK